MWHVSRIAPRKYGKGLLDVRHDKPVAPSVEISFIYGRNPDGRCLQGNHPKGGIVFPGGGIDPAPGMPVLHIQPIDNNLYV